MNEMFSFANEQSKIFQFNGSNSSIQERAKSLEVVQYIKDTYHDGKCDIASVEDGKLMADADAGEFWALFGGFAPLPRKAATDDDAPIDPQTRKLLCIERGKAEPLETESLTKELLETNKCYILDCGLEVFIWLGRNTSLDERKKASRAAEDIIHGNDRRKSHVIRVTEGHETVMFCSKFDSWPQTTEATASEDGRGRVAALLRSQGVNVKGLVKEDPVQEEPEPHIDCTGDLQVWRVNGEEKVLIPAVDQSKFYSGDCYIFHYSYPGEDREEHLIGTWFGKQSVEEERASATSLASKKVESLKFLPSQACFYQGNEPILFYSIFQSFIVLQGGLSDGYKNYIAEKGIPDDTYTEDSLALLRVQGSGPESMQAIQVEAVASSLNSSYCYILHCESSLFTWSGSLTTPENQEVVERMLDLIKPNLQCRTHKEGMESEQFWELLGGQSEHPNQKIARQAEGEPHLFACSFTEGALKVTEIYNFDQDDLMTEDIYILDCHSEIFVWVGQQVDTKNKMQALTIGEKFVEHDFLMEKLSREAPIYIVMEGSEPPFFTRFFKWDAKKSAMHGNSFQRKLAIVKHGGTPIIDKPKRRIPVSYGGRSGGVPEKSQRSRSVSFSPDRARVRGRSPAFNALAATFENTNTRNLSTPPQMGRKVFPKSGSPVSSRFTPNKAAAIAALTSSFEQPLPAREALMPRSIKASPEASKSKTETNNDNDSMSSIEEDVKEGEAEDDEGLPVYPYDRLTTTSTDPIEDIDVTKRESYLSSAEFKEKFGMTKDAFKKLPKWKQNKLKTALQLF